MTKEEVMKMSNSELMEKISEYEELMVELHKEATKLNHKFLNLLIGVEEFSNRKTSLRESMLQIDSDIKKMEFMLELRKL